MNRPIALLTDFGLTDHYVGSIKSVILSINPKAVIYDLTHEIRPQNIREGAYILNAIYNYLPKGTIVVAVVDPGVGSRREAVCVETNRGFLMGPDNGILSMALRHEQYKARKLTNDQYFLKPVSSTFHGRDIFSSCAAYLSQKNIFNSFGPTIERIYTLDLPKPVVTKDRICGEIVYIDRFGNTMTNISFKEMKWKSFSVLVGKQAVPMKPFFSAGRPGELFALWNSSQILELAVFNDSAERLHHLKLGDEVSVIASEAKQSKT